MLKHISKVSRKVKSFLDFIAPFKIIISLEYVLSFLYFTWSTFQGTVTLFIAALTVANAGYILLIKGKKLWPKVSCTLRLQGASATGIFCWLWIWKADRQTSTGCLWDFTLQQSVFPPITTNLCSKATVVLKREHCQWRLFTCKIRLNLSKNMMF